MDLSRIPSWPILTQCHTHDKHLIPLFHYVGWIPVGPLQVPRGGRHQARLQRDIVGLTLLLFSCGAFSESFGLSSLQILIWGVGPEYVRSSFGL